MKPPIPKLNNELLVLADCHGQLTAVIARREGKSWKIIARETTPASLAGLLAKLHPQRRIPAQALLVTTVCRPVLLGLEITSALSPAEATELLRWEIEEALRASPPLPEETANDPGDGGRRISHAPSAGGHTFTTAIHEESAARWSAELASQGLMLAGIFPWFGAPLPITEDGRALTLWQHTGSHLALFTLRRGALEFCGTCVAEREVFRSSLARDARSFDPARTLLVAPRELTAVFSEWLEAEKLPPAEVLPAPLDADCMFLGALTAAGSRTLLPAINLLPLPLPLWQRPTIWWTAAAAVFLIAALPLPLRWRTRFVADDRQSARLNSELKTVETKIEEIRISTDEFATLQTRRNAIEQEISRSRRSGALPGDSAFAQPEYIATVLRAVAEGCASRARLGHFTSDYEGKLVLKGTAPHDAVAQNAISAIYAQLEKRKDFKAVPLTTRRRQDGELGVEFEASENASAATFNSSSAPPANGP